MPAARRWGSGTEGPRAARRGHRRGRRDASSRGFFGIQFRIANDGANAEWVYLRQHKSGLPDALQYTPVLNTGLNWQIYNGPVSPVRSTSQRTLVSPTTGGDGRAGELYVKDMDKPALVIDDLKSGVQKGQVALAVLTGATYFFEFRNTHDARCAVAAASAADAAGHADAVELSPSYDALAAKSGTSARGLRERRHPVAGCRGGAARLRGPLSLSRSPHLKVSFANDFSKRLEPQPGMKVVYARTSIESDRDQVKKLYIGYSDDVSVFLNGKILFRGRSAQNFRDPGFLGIVEPGKRRGLPAVEEGRQRIGAGGERAGRRMGLHLPVRGHGTR